MRRQSLISVAVLVLGSALACGAWALGEERVKVEVTVPAVPNIGKVLIHTPNTTGYAAWDEATRGNAR